MKNNLDALEKLLGIEPDNIWDNTLRLIEEHSKYIKEQQRKLEELYLLNRFSDALALLKKMEKKHGNSTGTKRTRKTGKSSRNRTKDIR